MTHRTSLVCGLVSAVLMAAPAAGQVGNPLRQASDDRSAADTAGDDAGRRAHQAAELARSVAQPASSTSEAGSPDLTEADVIDPLSDEANMRLKEIRFDEAGVAVATDLRDASKKDRGEPQAEQPTQTMDSAAMENRSTAASPHRDDLAEFVSRALHGAVQPASGEEWLPPASEPNPYKGHSEVYCDPHGPVHRPLYWVAGAEATFLWPNLNRHEGSSFFFEDEARGTELWHSSFSDGVDSMYLTPRIWLGVQGCDWGTNVRYWHLRGNEGSFQPTIGDQLKFDDWGHHPAPESGFFTNNRLDAYTIDMELTRLFCFHDWAMQASFGVRYGLVDHHESVVGTVLDDDARFIGYARSDRTSKGTGIVMGLYGRKPLFPCSSVHWFYNVRWSPLWGRTNTAAETFAAVMVDGDNAGSVNTASSRVGGTMHIAEFQLGLEWNYALQCLPANAFFRAAVEYQRWSGGRGFSEAESFAGVIDTDGFVSAASTMTSASEPRMDLVGITLGTGLTW